MSGIRILLRVSSVGASGGPEGIEFLYLEAALLGPSLSSGHGSTGGLQQSSVSQA